MGSFFVKSDIKNTVRLAKSKSEEKIVLISGEMPVVPAINSTILMLINQQCDLGILMPDEWTATAGLNFA